MCRLSIQPWLNPSTIQIDNPCPRTKLSSQPHQPAETISIAVTKSIRRTRNLKILIKYSNRLSITTWKQLILKRSVSHWILSSQAKTHSQPIITLLGIRIPNSSSLSLVNQQLSNRQLRIWISLNRVHLRLRSKGVLWTQFRIWSSQICKALGIWTARSRKSLRIRSSKVHSAQ